MSGALLSLICLGLGAAIWLVAYGGRQTAKARPWLIGAGILAGPCLVVGCLVIAWAGGRFGELRLTLTQVTAEVRQFPMSLGGDSERDDLVTPRMAPAIAAVLPDPASQSPAAPLVLQIAASDKAPPQATVSIRRDGKLVYPTALPFAEGDAVCVLAPCERAGARWAILRGRVLAPASWRDGRVIPLDDAAPGRPMPQRKSLLMLGGINEWTPAQAIHPLRDVFPHAQATPATGILADCDRWLCRGADAERTPVRSFLFQKGGFRGSAWSIFLADPGARVARRAAGGELVVAPFSPPPPIRLGKGVAVDLWDVRYVDAPPDEPEARRGQLRLRRSLVLAEADGKAQVRFATAPTEVIGRCGTLTATPLRLSDASAGQPGAIRLPALGGRTAQAVNGPLPSPQARDCGYFSHAAFDLPRDGDALRSAAFGLDRLGTPWPMAWLAGLWAVGVLLACRELLARRPALWAIVCVLQLLLALRFLIGLAAAAADPALAWRDIVGDAAVAYVAAPAILLAWARWRTPRVAGDWLIDVAPPATAACVVLWTGGIGAPALMLLAGWLFCVLRRYGSAPAPRPSRKGPSAGDKAAAALARFDARFDWPAPSAGRDLFASGVALLVLVLVLRLATGALGWKERIDLGVMVMAISVLYTPPLIVGFSQMLASGQARPNSWVRPILFYILLVTATFVLPYAVKDSGYALMLAPIAGMASWCAWTHRKALNARLDAALLWTAPAVLVAALLVALPVAGAMVSAGAERLRLTPQMDRGLSDAEALDVLQAQARASQNVLRLYLLGAPEDLNNTGSAEAESLKVWSAQLSDYTGSLWGRGYLTSPNLTALRSVQATDNLTAVHLMSPFGRLATGLLLALLAATPIACAAMTRMGGPIHWRRACGFMALWCVFGAAFYMTLANLQLVPFTGRNAYLLAAASGGDLLEGVILFVMAAWGICSPAPAQARP